MALKHLGSLRIQKEGEIKLCITLLSLNFSFSRNLFMFPYSCLSKKLPYSCLSKKLFNLRVEKEEGRKRIMWYNNVDNGNNNQGAGIIAVAIDDGVSSQNALKWAIDHLVSRSTSHAPIKLVHVIHPSNSNNTLHATENNPSNEGQAHDAPNTDFLLPFRCYCTRKRVQCEAVLLEDQDVAEALAEYIFRHGIESIVVGATSRTGGLTRRLFKASESIPGRVLKLAPHFCSVYTIKQGRVSEMREASRPLPNIHVEERAADHQSDHIGRGPIYRAYDEVSVAENDVSFVSSERPSTDSILSFYQSFGPAGLTRYPLESSSNMESIAKLDEDFDSFDFYTPHEPSSTVQRCGGTPLLSQKVLDDMEEEMKRLRVELKQTMDMYHAACKEAVAAKQKTIELQEWKWKEGKKLEEARHALEATRAAMEKEKAHSKAAILTADHRHEVAQRFAEKEVQTTISADQIFKALREADDEEKKRVLDALGQSKIVFKYQSLVHILVVLLLFSFYCSLF